MLKTHLTIDHLTTIQIKRLFKQIKVDKSNHCWVWQGATRGTAHLRYGAATVNYRTMQTHQIMYAWLVEPLPRGLGRNILQLDHGCKNTLCCNPAHLELVTMKVNIARRSSTKATDTHCANGHKWTKQTTRLYRYRKTNGIWKQCLQCGRENTKTRDNLRKSFKQHQLAKRFGIANL